MTPRRLQSYVAGARKSGNCVDRAAEHAQRPEHVQPLLRCSGGDQWGHLGHDCRPIKAQVDRVVVGFRDLQTMVQLTNNAAIGAVPDNAGERLLRVRTALERRPELARRRSVLAPALRFASNARAASRGVGAMVGQGRTRREPTIAMGPLIWLREPSAPSNAWCAGGTEARRAAMCRTLFATPLRTGLREQRELADLADLNRLRGVVQVDTKPAAQGNLPAATAHQKGGMH